VSPAGIVIDIGGHPREGINFNLSIVPGETKKWLAQELNNTVTG